MDRKPDPMLAMKARRIMPTSNPVDIMLAHDSWATRQILDACAKLTPEQFHRRFEMGCGSLHDTTLHMITAMRIWTDILAVRDVRPRLEGSKQSVPELIGLLDAATTEFAAVARAHPLDEMVTRVRDGKTYK